MVARHGAVVRGERIDLSGQRSPVHSSGPDTWPFARPGDSVRPALRWRCITLDPGFAAGVVAAVRYGGTFVPYRGVPAAAVEKSFNRAARGASRPWDAEQPLSRRPFSNCRGRRGAASWLE